MSSLPPTQSPPDVEALSLADSTVSAASVFENMDILKLIISMVGRNQYCFIARVNQRWKQTYLDVFPRNKMTKLNVSTEGHARLCWEDFTGVRNSTYEQSQLCRSAAFHGSLPALQFLRSVWCSWNASTCEAAARNGHFDILKWCRDNGCRWDARTCEVAARNGHFDILKWSRDNGCPWDALTCAAAARNGHFDILKWCRDNGCPWSGNECFELASDNGHQNVISYLSQEGYPIYRYPYDDDYYDEDYFSDDDEYD